MDGFGLIKMKKFSQGMVRKYTSMLEEDYNSHKVQVTMYTNGLLLNLKERGDAAQRSPVRVSQKVIRDLPNAFEKHKARQA